METIFNARVDTMTTYWLIDNGGIAMWFPTETEGIEGKKELQKIGFKVIGGPRQ